MGNWKTVISYKEFLFIFLFFIYLFIFIFIFFYLFIYLFIYFIFIYFYFFLMFNLSVMLFQFMCWCWCWTSWVGWACLLPSPTAQPLVWALCTLHSSHLSLMYAGSGRSTRHSGTGTLYLFILFIHLFIYLF